MKNGKSLRQSIVNLVIPDVDRRGPNQPLIDRIELIRLQGTPEPFASYTNITARNISIKFTIYSLLEGRL